MKTIYTEFTSVREHATVGYLSFAEHWNDIYSTGDVVYLWIVDNVKNQMKKIQYTNLEYRGAKKSCLIVKFIEGYHIGGK